MSMELILLIAAVGVSVLLLVWLLRVAKATLRAAVTIAGIALLLQLLFGIGPADLFQEVEQLLQAAWQMVIQALEQQLQP